jgi:hypothetical protein
MITAAIKQCIPYLTKSTKFGVAIGFYALAGEEHFEKQ